MGHEFLLFIQYNFTKYCCSTLKNKNSDYQQVKQFFCKAVLFFSLKKLCNVEDFVVIYESVVSLRGELVPVLCPLQLQFLLSLNKCKNQKYLHKHS